MPQMVSPIGPTLVRRHRGMAPPVLGLLGPCQVVDGHNQDQARAQGPLLLKNLSGIHFDSMKYLARDDAWLKDEHNGEKLLKLMDTKELFGEDDREDMLASLVKITYGLRRANGEDYRSCRQEA